MLGVIVNLGIAALSVRKWAQPLVSFLCASLPLGTLLVALLTTGEDARRGAAGLPGGDEADSGGRDEMSLLANESTLSMWHTLPISF